MSTPSEMLEVEIEVNGVLRRLKVESRALLSDLLRHELGLTGTHVGCEHGVCGSCTVVVNGDAVRSCLLLAVQVDGSSVETVESLSADGNLCEIQRAMSSEHGLQCGFCTPGILMSLHAAKVAGMPVADVLDDVVGGRVCRCTGYTGIRAAVRLAWEEST